MSVYAVFGHPVAHSRSPQIHAAFARQHGKPIVYERICVPVDGFAGAMADFFGNGGAGANVTVPFKTEAFDWADVLSARARAAGAVNTLHRQADGVIYGDNTDGVGLVYAIEQLHKYKLAGKRVLLVGAGGAARGVVQPLQAASVASLAVVNRTVSTAQALAKSMDIAWLQYEDLLGHDFDVLINATSASLSGALVPVPDALLGKASLVYDMMYASQLTPFLQHAKACGAAEVADGLGMLVAQAAVAYALWRDFEPDWVPVVTQIRQEMESTCAG